MSEPPAPQPTDAESRDGACQVRTVVKVPVFGGKIVEQHVPCLTQPEWEVAVAMPQIGGVIGSKDDWAIRTYRACRHHREKLEKLYDQRVVKVRRYVPGITTGEKQ